jgi:hypothetical protein
LIDQPVLIWRELECGALGFRLDGVVGHWGSNQELLGSHPGYRSTLTERYLSSQAPIGYNSPQ